MSATTDQIHLTIKFFLAFLQARRAELLSFVATSVNLGLLFGWWDWTTDQVAGANLFAVALLGVLIGRTHNHLKDLDDAVTEPDPAG